jgi:ferredoxin
LRVGRPKKWRNRHGGTIGETVGGTYLTRRPHFGTWNETCSAVLPGARRDFAAGNGAESGKSAARASPGRHVHNGSKFMAKYKIEVDRDLCVGDGACVNEAPKTFEMDDEAIAIIINPEGDSPEDILNAAQVCPVDAIILHDADSGEKVWPED